MLLLITPLKDEITNFSKEKLFLISSHNLLSLERLCEHFILLSKGVLKKEESKEDVGKSLYKYQILFTQEVTEEELKSNGISVINLKKVGSVVYLITLSDDKDLIIEKYHPTLIENVVIDKDEALKLEMMIREGDIK